MGPQRELSCATDTLREYHGRLAQRNAAQGRGFSEPSLSCGAEAVDCVKEGEELQAEGGTQERGPQGGGAAGSRKVQRKRRRMCRPTFQEVWLLTEEKQ